MEPHFPDAETIDKILDIAKPEIHYLVDALGRHSTYSTKHLHEVIAVKPAEIPLVKVYTLQAVRDLILQGLEKTLYAVKPQDCFLHVENETTVTLKDKEADDYGRRQVLILAQPVPFEKFPFGKWMDQETFAIGIASQFADGGDKDYVLKLAAELTTEATGASTDNGFVQRVTTQAGIAHKIVQEIKPRVVLAPFRIFPEVVQPGSAFVLRARVGDDKRPQLCLYEADGGTWKVRAIEIIRQKLEEFETGVQIIA